MHQDLHLKSVGFRLFTVQFDLSNTHRYVSHEGYDMKDMTVDM